MTVFKKAKAFIYRNARPLDLARWQYHFENGNKENILKALSFYQNDDGGFGHAIEADSFNPNSAPIQTWAATEILREIDFKDKNHPIIKGILNYLDSGSDFDTLNNQWLNTVPSNNNYPHAVWWQYGENGSEFKYNPTACLAGFIIRFADKNSELYKKGCNIAKQAFEYFIKNVPFEEMHVINCFIRLYEYCSESDSVLFDMSVFKNKLIEQVNSNICKDTDKWQKEYVTLPSSFIKNKKSIFYTDNSDIAEAECEFILNNQLPDGAFPVPFQWFNEYKESEIAINWWKSEIIINNMRYLSQMGKI